VGGVLGWLIGRQATSGCQLDDCDVGGALGFVVGSWAGGTVGAYAGASRGGRRASLGRALGGSSLGILSGALAAILVGRLYDDSETHSQVPVAVVYSVAQGAMAGLFASGGGP
jgi:hypothetical protein